MFSTTSKIFNYFLSMAGLQKGERRMSDFNSFLLDGARAEKVQKLSVAAALIHENKLLMLKRRPDDFMPGIFELPGGALEDNETLYDALRRELQEETSCEINRIVGYIGYFDFPSSSGKLTRRFNFLVEPKLPLQVKLSEHSGFSWIVPAEADQYPITPQTKGMIALVKNNKIHKF